MYTVCTWNINGIRSLKDLNASLDMLNAHIVCLQETKITREMLTEPVAFVDGYVSCFDFSQRRSGYSGVATYSRSGATPVSCAPGLTGGTPSSALLAEFQPAELRALDAEGRCVLTQHRVTCRCAGEERVCQLAVINVYCPRVDPERPERLTYKLQFYRALRLRVAALLSAGSHVLVVGDLNCSHRPIDSCDPGDEQGFRADPCRQFLDSWLVDPSSDRPDPLDSLVDTFRHLHPNAGEVYTCWNTQKNARAANFGTRIDYVLCDVRLCGQLARCDVMSAVEGSDHCPVSAEFLVWPLAADRLPAGCTRFYPEFSGRQVTLRQLWARLPTPAVPAGKRTSPASRGPAGSKRARPATQGTLLAFFSRPVAVTAAAEEAGDADDSAGNGTGSSGYTSLSQNSADSSQNSAESAASVSSQSSAVSSQSSADSSQDSAESAVSAPSQESAAGSSPRSDRSDPGSERARQFWRSTLKASKPPLCSGHQQPCVLRTVRKQGQNLGRQFWCCARGVGKADNPLARCNFFQWHKR